MEHCPVFKEEIQMRLPHLSRFSQIQKIYFPVRAKMYNSLNIIIESIVHFEIFRRNPAVIGKKF